MNLNKQTWGFDYRMNVLNGLEAVFILFFQEVLEISDNREKVEGTCCT